MLLAQRFQNFNITHSLSIQATAGPAPQRLAMTPIVRSQYPNGHSATDRHGEARIRLARRWLAFRTRCRSSLMRCDGNVPIFGEVLGDLFEHVGFRCRPVHRDALMIMFVSLNQFGSYIDPGLDVSQELFGA